MPKKNATELEALTACCNLKPQVSILEFVKFIKTNNIGNLGDLSPSAKSKAKNKWWSLLEKHINNHTKVQFASKKINKYYYNQVYIYKLYQLTAEQKSLVIHF